jgi:hypothetical protein
MQMEANILASLNQEIGKVKEYGLILKEINILDSG